MAKIGSHGKGRMINRANLNRSNFMGTVFMVVVLGALVLLLVGFIASLFTR